MYLWVKSTSNIMNGTLKSDAYWASWDEIKCITLMVETVLGDSN
jgi:hypothetical protein